MKSFFTSIAIIISTQCFAVPKNEKLPNSCASPYDIVVAQLQDKITKLEKEINEIRNIQLFHTEFLEYENYRVNDIDATQKSILERLFKVEDLDQKIWNDILNKSH